MKPIQRADRIYGVICGFLTAAAMAERDSFDEQMMEVTLDSLLKSDVIDPGQYARDLFEWCQGNAENHIIPPHVAFVLNDENFLRAPLAVSRRKYTIKDCDISDSTPLSRNAVTGLTHEWYQNATNQCIVTHFDPRCVIVCLVQACVIHRLANGDEIDWIYIYEMCEDVISRGDAKVRNSREFNDYWYIGMRCRGLDVGDVFREISDCNESLMIMVLIMAIADSPPPFESCIWHIRKHMPEGARRTAAMGAIGAVIGAAIGYTEIQIDGDPRASDMPKQIRAKAVDFCDLYI